MLVDGPRLRFGASVWGFYGRRPAAEHPPLADAVHAILSLDPSLGVEVWGSRALDRETVGEPELAALVEACRAAAFVTAHVRGVNWRWDPAGLRREIGFAHRVGAETLVLHPVCLGLADPGDRIDVPEIRRLAAEAAAHGVRLAVENLRDAIETLDRLLERIGDRPEKTNLWVCIDVGHAHLSQDAGREPIVNYLERYAAQLTHVHLHDNGCRADDHLIPGAGTVDWPRALRALEGIGFDGTAVLEVHPADRTPSEGVRDGLAFLSALAGGR